MVRVNELKILGFYASNQWYSTWQRTLFQLLRFLLRIASLGRIKRVGLQASTGRVQKMTSFDTCSPCVQLVTTTIFQQGVE